MPLDTHELKTHSSKQGALIKVELVIRYGSLMITTITFRCTLAPLL